MQLRLILLMNELGEIVDKETGEISRFVRLSVEVASSQGPYSRCQFTVKIPECSKIKIENEKLENADFELFLSGLEVSYVDTKGVVYFRADSYDVEEFSN